MVFDAWASRKLSRFGLSCTVVFECPDLPSRPGEFHPAHRSGREPLDFIRLVPSREGCRLPLDGRITHEWIASAWLQIAWVTAWSSMPKLVVKTIRPRAISRIAATRGARSRLRQASADLASSLECGFSTAGSAAGANALRTLS